MAKFLTGGRVAAALVLAASAAIVGPRALDACEWLAIADDPAALTDRALARDLPAARLAGELAAALDAGDIDLAASFLELATQQGLVAPADLRARYEVANTTAASLGRGVKSFYDGLTGGEARDGAGIAGVVAADISGVGDVRDLVTEGGKIARGEEPDRLVLGLAAAGLAVTGATIASMGAAMPARAGVSTLKVAARTGRLSAPLAASLGRAVGAAVDSGAARRAAVAAARLDVAGARLAAREAVNPAALARLRGIAGDVSTLGGRMGARGAQEALALARDPADLRRLARVAEARGGGARAALKVLGRGAIGLGAGVVTLAGWVMAGVGWLWAAVIAAVALTRGLARLAWRGVKIVRGGVRLLSGSAAGRPRLRAPAVHPAR